MRVAMYVCTLLTGARGSCPHPGHCRRDARAPGVTPYPTCEHVRSDGGVAQCFARRPCDGVPVTVITRRGGPSFTPGYRPRGPLLTLVGHTALTILHQRQLASDLLDRHPLLAIEI